MNEFNNNPIMPSSSGGGTPGPAGWIPVWIKAVSQPNEQTFIDISESPDALPKTAYIWVFIATTVSWIAIGFAYAVSAAIQTMGQSNTDGATMGAVILYPLLGILCASPFAGGLSILFFALDVAIKQWVAQLFGGTGNYDKLVYAFAAVAAPIGIVSSVFTFLGAIPFVAACTGIISSGLGLYATFLQITAVKAVNRFEWGQAIGSVLIPGVVISVTICACIFGIVMVLGLSMGDIFNHRLYP